jgi:large subunit ribosomal protein L9
MIEVILLERIERLGRMGDIVKVKPGYARNFLLPKRKALRATNDNRKYFETQRAHIEAENLKRKDEAGVAAKALDGRTVVLIRQAGDTGQLYGSVSTRDIADALSDGGAIVNKSQVVLDKPIKALGIHGVRIVLHPEVAVTIKTNVARSPEEAELQAKGVDVARMRDDPPEPVEAPEEAEMTETSEA